MIVYTLDNLTTTWMQLPETCALLVSFSSVASRNDHRLWLLSRFVLGQLNRIHQLGNFVKRLLKGADDGLKLRCFSIELSYCIARLKQLGKASRCKWMSIIAKPWIMNNCHILRGDDCKQDCVSRNSNSLPLWDRIMMGWDLFTNQMSEWQDVPVVSFTDSSINCGSDNVDTRWV